MLNFHYENCPKIGIMCIQGCGDFLERSNMKKHIEEICSFTLIGCVFKDYGCNTSFMRKDLKNHFIEQQSGKYKDSIIVLSEAYEEAKECFRLFDKRDRQVITAIDIKPVLAQYLPFPPTDQDVMDFIAECDKTGTGHVTLSDFKALYLS